MDQNDYPGYTDAQVEAARVWAYVIKNVPSELNISNSAAGTKIYNGGLVSIIQKMCAICLVLIQQKEISLMHPTVMGQ